MECALYGAEMTRGSLATHLWRVHGRGQEVQRSEPEEGRGHMDYMASFSKSLRSLAHPVEG